MKRKHILAPVPLTYEEKTGLAISADLRDWQCLNPDGPWLTSPHGSGSLRYLDAQVVGRQLLLFYEFARPDGAHDLRLTLGSPESWLASLPIPSST